MKFLLERGSLLMLDIPSLEWVPSAQMHSLLLDIITQVYWLLQSNPYRNSVVIYSFSLGFTCLSFLFSSYFFFNKKGLTSKWEFVLYWILIWPNCSSRSATYFSEFVSTWVSALIKHHELNVFIAFRHVYRISPTKLHESSMWQ